MYSKMRELCSCVLFFIFVNNFYNHCLADNNVTRHISEDSRTVTSNSSDEVSETQHATCRISSEELVASAEATVTRVLTGVCNADTVEARFQNLERLIKREFDEIKKTLNSIAGSIQRNFTPEVDPRQEEIDRLNNTLITVNTATGMERAFSYFARVKNFDEKASRWESGRFERSPSFYLPLRTYSMYVKVTPRDVRGGISYVNIGAGLARGRNDEYLEWPFPLKHQVEILDHSGPASGKDLIASIVNPLVSGSPDHWERPGRFGGEENRAQTGIAIPTSFILNDHQQQIGSDRNGAKYLWHRDLIVKLTVYL